MIAETAFDPEGVEVISPVECLRLLATVPLGRVIYHENGLPAVRLVNFVVDRGALLFRVAEGQTLRAARRAEVVAFEVDDYDVERHLGWTVTALGHLTEVVRPDEQARMRELRLRPWAPGNRPYLIRLDAETITGRGVRPWAQRPHDGSSA